MNNINKCCVCYKTDYETKINFKICHGVCLYCLQNMINKYKIYNCPLCRKQYNINDLKNKNNYDEYITKDYETLTKKYHKYNLNKSHKIYNDDDDSNYKNTFFDNLDNSPYQIKSFIVY